MQGEQYYLYLLDSNGKYHCVSEKPTSIEEIDRITTKYDTEKDFIDELLTSNNLRVKRDFIEGVYIKRKVNKTNRLYQEIGPFYKEDKDILNIERTLARLEIKIQDKRFVSYMLTPYAEIPGFKNLIIEIFGLMNSDSNYFGELQELLEKLTKTYKGCRNMYNDMKRYDHILEVEEKSKYKPESTTQKKSSEKKLSSKRKIKNVDFHREELGTDEKLTKAEILRSRLEYLRDYDRELLDIEDFIGNHDISPFDDDARRIK